MSFIFILAGGWALGWSTASLLGGRLSTELVYTLFIISLTLLAKEVWVYFSLRSSNDIPRSIFFLRIPGFFLVISLWGFVGGALAPLDSRFKITWFYVMGFTGIIYPVISFLKRKIQENDS